MQIPAVRNLARGSARWGRHGASSSAVAATPLLHSAAHPLHHCGLWPNTTIPANTTWKAITNRSNLSKPCVRKASYARVVMTPISTIAQHMSPRFCPTWWNCTALLSSLCQAALRKSMAGNSRLCSVLSVTWNASTAALSADVAETRGGIQLCARWRAISKGPVIWGIHLWSLFSCRNTFSAKGLKACKKASALASGDSNSASVSCIKPMSIGSKVPSSKFTALCEMKSSMDCSNTCQSSALARLLTATGSTFALAIPSQRPTRKAIAARRSESWISATSLA
mmetsp:Transcript_10046/g.25123  ORF Transcript_10046/g.25123 Transcript_10046/m.25123 type:complete len:282 (-) Transcript_10046:457-1302(-)